jgi:polyphenol oxidase
MTRRAMSSFVETFSALQDLGCIHGFTRRIPGLDVKAAREIALARLDESHVAARRALGLDGRRFVIARQVHGCEVAVVEAAGPGCIDGVDGLITASPEVCLGIYVADCCPVCLVDPVRRVIGLLHSGRKGSALGIASAAITRMADEFQCEPAQIVALLGPCIRPPHYEIDFAAQIIHSCRAAGLTRIIDCGICTACHPDLYYSYRAELGQTGRMLALLALE